MELAKKWLKYMSGTWSTEYRTAIDGEWRQPQKGEIELKLVAEGLAVCSCDERWAVTTGWDSGKQAVVTFVIGARGFVIRAEMPTITENELSGKLTVTYPNGTVRESTRTWKKVDDDNLVRTASGSADGRKFEEKSTWKRLKPRQLPE